MATRFLRELRALLDQPRQVFIICLTCLAAGLLFDGTLMSLWSLHRRQETMIESIAHLQSSNQRLAGTIHQLRNPSVVKRMARERFDLVGRNELIFLFK